MKKKIESHYLDVAELWVVDDDVTRLQSEMSHDRAQALKLDRASTHFVTDEERR